ncbi:hypothetical protein BP6252_01416 [Coleophoma cylindrospora]|uniref:Uncharacterized protein n=1 Tax=Coleophoma cylindrospora TaxID=1849047 RepID=A0A3D8ST22_9HELO|nr:hypothetical protein BP6252_01416 [Coleophoma cylindrospora]
MSWLAVTAAVLYYTFLPLTTLVRWILICLAPLIQLFHYFMAALMFPVHLLARFETLYIYLGIAAVIGLITGSILYFSSTVLISLFNLESVPEDKGRTAASVRAAREQRKLEEAWQSSSLNSEQTTRWKADTSMQKWLEKDAERRRDERGILGQTILEEDDDSEDVF